IFIARGEGAHLIDIDGNCYLDFISSWGPLILGHCHPRVMQGVNEALAKGASFGAPTEAESDLAELITQLVPSMEMVRMVSSGTEAAMSVIRLARGATGSSATTLGVPSSPGVPKGCTNDTLVLEFNDLLGLKEAFAKKGDQIAGVILEPVVGNMGLVVPSREFLTELRGLTQKHDSLLIYDE